MKLTEIRDAVTKDLSDYVGEFVFYLYQHGSLRFKLRGCKQYKGTYDDRFYDELDRGLGTMALNHLKYGACIDGFGFRIEGTITYETRYDYIPAKDGDDAKSMFLEQRIMMILDALSSGEIPCAIELCCSAEHDCQEFMKMREDSLKKDHKEVQKDDQEDD